jgi:hypothetical protein
MSGLRSRRFPSATVQGEVRPVFRVAHGQGSPGESLAEEIADEELREPLVATTTHESRMDGIDREWLGPFRNIEPIPIASRKLCQ